MFISNVRVRWCGAWMPFSVMLGVLLMLPALLVAQDDEPWTPEKMYQPMLEEGSSAEGPTRAAAELAEWATLPPVGPKGRPLPVGGSWMAEHMYGPKRTIEMIEQGHHLLITFLDPISTARWTLGDQRNAEQRVKDRIENYYRPGLEYARKHKLPIVFRGWNWGDSVGGLQTWKERYAGAEIPPQQSVRMVIDGEVKREMDPFGPVEGWREFGRFWMANEVMKQVQAIYPDPPMVIFLNNNEGPKVRSVGQMPDDYWRFVAEHGEGPHSQHDKAVAIRKGYEQRYAAMLESAREAMTSPTWQANTKFVAYNTLWDTGYIGHGNRPSQGIWFEPDEGWLAWRMYDGSMPELYDNDWQPGKTDHTPNGMQVEAMNYFSAQPRIFEQDPDFYWSTIVWEGGRTGDVWRGRRGTSKPFHYITRGQQWSFDRHEGWVQFCLWVTRPRTMREFRWPPSDEHAFDEGTWMAMVRSIDRPWRNGTLKQFWRFGELVPNPDESHPFELEADQPQWAHDLQRWYLLTCDANPPRAAWHERTALRVFAIALVRGEAPTRQWLIYAHAPRGAVADATVDLPGFGEVTLDHVPLSGSFFLVDESEHTTKPLLRGGPAQVELTTEGRWRQPGETVTFNAAVTMPPTETITRYVWSIDGKTVATQESLAAFEHAFEEPGDYVVRVIAETKSGATAMDEVAIHVGEKPGGAIVYDLPLDRAFAWEGPWDDSGEPDHDLITYRHLPNRGLLPPAVLVGGAFVDDEQRGRVLELAGGVDTVWLIRNAATVMDKAGHPDRTISFHFKADAIEGRQVLYAQGFHGNGYNIYLDGDTLYAGGWSPAGSMDATGWHPIWGRGWKGDWVSHAGIESGKWYHVSFVVKDAGDTVEPDKHHLFINGEKVATGPGARVPRQYATPRLGQAQIDGKLLTRFHDDAKDAAPFRGRIDDFLMANEAILPPR